MKQCRKCDAYLRDTDFPKDGRHTCKACVQARTRTWIRANKERIYAKNRAWRAANHEAHLARRRINERGKYKRPNEYFRNRYATSAKAKATDAVNKARRRARLAGVLSTLTHAQWEAVLELFGRKCAYCGKQDDKLTRDHVVPISRGGNDTLDNIVPACQPCNSSKGARTMEEWRG